MQTRTTNYSDERILITRFGETIKNLCYKVKNAKDIDKVDIINSIVCYIHKNNMLKFIQTPKYILVFEHYYLIMLKNNKSYKTDLVSFSQKKENDNELFKKKTKQLLQNSHKMTQFIHNYFNLKYLYVLLRTNRDVYRIIMSYL